MMGRKMLSEIKAELGLPADEANGKSPKKRPTVRPDAAEMEKTLTKKLAELELEVRKRRKPTASRPVKG